MGEDIDGREMLLVRGLRSFEWKLGGEGVEGKLRCNWKHRGRGGKEKENRENGGKMDGGIEKIEGKVV